MKTEGEPHKSPPSRQFHNGPRSQRSYGIRNTETDHHVSDVADSPCARHEGLEEIIEIPRIVGDRIDGGRMYVQHWNQRRGTLVQHQWILLSAVSAAGSFLSGASRWLPTVWVPIAPLPSPIYLCCTWGRLKGNQKIIIPEDKSYSY